MERDGEERERERDGNILGERAGEGEHGRKDRERDKYGGREREIKGDWESGEGEKVDSDK